MEKGSQGRWCCLGEADGEQLESDTHIWQRRVRGEAAPVTTAPLATALRSQGCGSSPGSVPREGLMLHRQVDAGEGAAALWPIPRQGFTRWGSGSAVPRGPQVEEPLPFPPFAYM